MNRSKQLESFSKKFKTRKPQDEGEFAKNKHKKKEHWREARRAKLAEEEEVWIQENRKPTREESQRDELPVIKDTRPVIRPPVVSKDNRPVIRPPMPPKDNRGYPTNASRDNRPVIRPPVPSNGNRNYSSNAPRDNRGHNRFDSPNNPKG